MSSRKLRLTRIAVEPNSIEFQIETVHQPIDHQLQCVDQDETSSTAQQSDYTQDDEASLISRCQQENGTDSTISEENESSSVMISITLGMITVVLLYLVIRLISAALSLIKS